MVAMEMLGCILKFSEVFLEFHQVQIDRWCDRNYVIVHVMPVIDVQMHTTNLMSHLLVSGYPSICTQLFP